MIDAVEPHLLDALSGEVLGQAVLQARTALHVGSDDDVETANVPWL
jgi:hypothetical protein